MGDQWLELRRQLLINRDKGDTLSRRFRDAFACDYLLLFHLPPRRYIVTSFVVLYRLPRNALPILPSILVIDVNTPNSTRFWSGTRDLLF